MKTLLTITTALVVSVNMAVAEENVAMPSNTFAGALQYYMPGQDDDYDSGFGVEGQIRFWQSQTVGLALAGGFANWEINDQEAVISDGLVAVAAAMEGDVLLIPIGGSVLLRPKLSGNLDLILEGGLRYVIVESDAEAAIAAANAFGGVVGGSAEIEIDDGVVGLIAANLEADLSPGLSLFGGVGYQFDLAKGDAKWMGEDFGENELKAFFLRVGLGFDF